MQVIILDDALGKEQGDIELYNTAKHALNLELGVYIGNVSQGWRSKGWSYFDLEKPNEIWEPSNHTTPYNNGLCILTYLYGEEYHLYLVDGVLLAKRSEGSEDLKAIVNSVNDVKLATQVIELNDMSQKQFIELVPALMRDFDAEVSGKEVTVTLKEDKHSLPVKITLDFTQDKTTICEFVPKITMGIDNLPYWVLTGINQDLGNIISHLEQGFLYILTRNMMPEKDETLAVVEQPVLLELGTPNE